MKRIRKIWNFIWYDDSPLSWIINIILALILVKFLIYPGLGLVLGTTHPLVAVVSGSMEHDGMGFDDWWESNGRWYEENNIKKEEFEKFPFKHGFNKGDIMVLINSRKINVGDVIVYNGNSEHPIIHRIVKVNDDSTYVLKGDHNGNRDKEDVKETIGEAVLRIPFLGYIKIWFVDLILNKITVSEITGIFK